jgi:hypothetical protein
MTGYKHDTSRPNKLQAISDSIDVGFGVSVLGGLHKRGVGYYTLGGETFNDLRIFYNVFGERLRFAVSYENKHYAKCKTAGSLLQESGALSSLPLHVLSGDILASDLRYCRRDDVGLIIFLDLTQFISFAHREYFERWIVARALQPGDVIYVTSSLPPWELVRDTFVAKLTPVLRDMGASNGQLQDRAFWKHSYVKCLLQYFADGWRYQQLSRLGFRHFFERLYRDTRIEMAMNGFVVVED